MLLKEKKGKDIGWANILYIFHLPILTQFPTFPTLLCALGDRPLCPKGQTSVNLHSTSGFPLSLDNEINQQEIERWEEGNDGSLFPLP